MAPHLPHLVHARPSDRPGLVSIVVAEDNASLRSRLVHELGQCAPDAAVAEAVTAAEAVALLATRLPHTVLLDVSLPDRDGLDLALALRRGGFAGRLVLLTTDRSEAGLAGAARAGASVLHKPFTPEDVRDALAAVPATASDDVAARPAVLLPSVAQVRSLLGELLRIEPELVPGPPVLPRPGSAASVALYVRDRLETGALLVADLRMSLWLAGSLGLLTTEALAAQLARPSWPLALGEDLHEAADVLRSLFTLPSTPSLRLYSVHRPGSLLDAPLARSVAAVQSRLDLVVATPGSGPAGLSLVVPRA